MPNKWVDVLNRANHTGMQPLSSIEEHASVVQLEDVNGAPGLPAVDGSQLTGLGIVPGPSDAPTVFFQNEDPGDTARVGDVWIESA